MFHDFRWNRNLGDALQLIDANRLVVRQRSEFLIVVVVQATGRRHPVLADAGHLKPNTILKSAALNSRR